MINQLKTVGVTNVTFYFKKSIKYGFYTNLIFVWFRIYKMNTLKNAKKGDIFYHLYFLEFLVDSMWGYQFLIMVWNRLSHGGMVCSGDYIGKMEYESEMG